MQLNLVNLKNAKASEMSPPLLLWILGLSLAVSVTGHANGNGFYKEDDYLFNHLRDFPVFAQDLEKTAISQSEETDSKEVQPGPQITVNIIIENSPMMIKNSKEHDRTHEEKKYDHRPHFLSKPKTTYGHGHDARQKQHPNGNNLHPTFQFPMEKDKKPITVENGKQEVKVSVVPRKAVHLQPNVVVVHKNNEQVSTPKHDEQDEAKRVNYLHVTQKPKQEPKLMDFIHKPEYRAVEEKLRTDAKMAQKMIDSVNGDPTIKPEYKQEMSTNSELLTYLMKEKTPLELKRKNETEVSIENETTPEKLPKEHVSPFKKDAFKFVPLVDNRLDAEPIHEEKQVLGKHASNLSEVKTYPLDSKDVPLPIVDQFLGDEDKDNLLFADRARQPFGFQHVIQQRLHKRSVNSSEGGKENVEADKNLKEPEEDDRKRQIGAEAKEKMPKSKLEDIEKTSNKPEEPVTMETSNGHDLTLEPKTVEKELQHDINAKEIEPEEKSIEEEKLKHNATSVNGNANGKQPRAHEIQHEEAKRLDESHTEHKSQQFPQPKKPDETVEHKSEHHEAKMVGEEHKAKTVDDEQKADNKSQAMKDEKVAEKPKVMMIVEKEDESNKKPNITSMEQLEKNHLPLLLGQKQKPVNEAPAQPSLPGVWNRVLPYLAILKRDANTEVTNNAEASAQYKKTTDGPKADQLNKISYLQF